MKDINFEDSPGYFMKDDNGNLYIEYSQFQKLQQRIKRLEYYKTTTIGFWCIDKDPNRKDVSLDWVRVNAFQLKGGE